MEENLAFTDMTKESTILYQQIGGRYIKMAWNHTLQLKESDIREARSKRFKIYKQSLSAISSAGVISIVFTALGGTVWAKIGTAIFTVLTMIATWLCDNSTLDADVKRARSLAAECHDMRNKYESLMADIKTGAIGIDEILSRRSQLEEVEDELLKKDFLSVSAKAKKIGRKALMVDMEAQSTEDEWKKIVPKDLQLDEEG